MASASGQKNVAAGGPAAQPPNTRPDHGPLPEPGPAPVGPAVHEPKQKPASTPHDPGPAPPGPAVEHHDK